MKEISIIPKDCCLCDVCNKQLTDSQFIALEYCFWYEGWLYCDSCNKEYKPMRELKLIAEIEIGEDLSTTDLAKPIIMEFEK